MKRGTFLGQIGLSSITIVALLGLVLGSLLLGTPEEAHAQLPTDRPPRIAVDTIVSVSTSSASVSQGEEFDIVVSISTTPEDMTIGAQFSLTYDPSMIEIIGFTEGNFYKDWALAKGIDTIVIPEPFADNNAGVVPTVAIALFGYLPDDVPDRPSGSGTLLVMQAKAKNKTGSVDLELTDVVVTDFPSAGNRADVLAYEGVKIQNGVLTVGEGTVQEAPAVELVPTETRPPALVERPTVAVVTPQGAIGGSDGGLGSSLLLAIPIVGAIVIGAVVFFAVRKK